MSRFLQSCLLTVLILGVVAACGGSGSGGSQVDPSEDPGLHIEGFVEDDGQRQAGVTVRLLRDGSIVAETTSGSDGTFLFANLEGELADYRVRIVGEHDQD